jgi:hypothetical protein
MHREGRGAWAGSYWRLVRVDYVAKNWQGFLLVNGRIAFFDADAAKPGFNISSPSKGWRYKFEPTSSIYWQYHGQSSSGFYYQRGSYTWFTIPLYFPTLLSAALLWFAWRQTGVKTSSKAFPIEPTTSGT